MSEHDSQINSREDAWVPADPDASPNIAQLWTLDPRRLQPELLKQTCRSWLDSTEASRFKAIEPERKHEYLAAHALLRVVVGRFTHAPPGKVQFSRRRFGKLQVTSAVTPVHFNLSHTENLAAVLISDAGPVGLDIERIDRVIDPEQIARHFGSATMQEQLAAVPASRRQAWLYRQWVLHEALLKACGIGLSDRVPLRPMPLDPTTHSGVYGRYQLQLFELTASTIAAAAIRSLTPVTIEICEGEALFEAGIAVVN